MRINKRFKITVVTDSEYVYDPELETFYIEEDDHRGYIRELYEDGGEHAILDFIMNHPTYKHHIKQGQETVESELSEMYANGEIPDPEVDLDDLLAYEVSLECQVEDYNPEYEY